MRSLFKALAWAPLCAILWAAGPAMAAIAIVPGTGANGSLFHGSLTGNSTQTIATTADCPAGSLIFVSVAYSAAISPVTDSAGNTYTALQTFTNQGGGVNNASFVALNTVHDLPSGGLVTVITAGSGDLAQVSGACFSGLAASPIDANGAGTKANSTAVSFTTGTLAQASELAITVNISDNATASFTGFSGFTLFETVAQSFKAQLWTGYQVVSSTTAVAASGTLIATRNWGANVFTFKAAGIVTATPKQTLLGVGQ